jgi:hypothetical protein
MSYQRIPDEREVRSKSLQLVLEVVYILETRVRL